MEKIHPASPTVADGVKNGLHRLKRGNEAGYQPGFNPRFYNLCEAYRHRPGQTDGIGQATVAFGLLAPQLGWGRKNITHPLCSN